MSQEISNGIELVAACETYPGWMAYPVTPSLLAHLRGVWSTAKQWELQSAVGEKAVVFRDVSVLVGFEIQGNAVRLSVTVPRNDVGPVAQRSVWMPLRDMQVACNLPEGAEDCLPAHFAQTAAVPGAVFYLMGRDQSRAESLSVMERLYAEQREACGVPWPTIGAIAVCDRLIAEVVELRKAWYADAPVATAIVLMQVIDPEQDDGVVWSADQYPCLLRWQVTPEQLVALQAAFHEAMFHRADDATIAAALTVDDRKACDIDMSVEYVAPQVAGPGTVDLASMAGADAERSAGRVELRLAWNDHVYFWASHAGVEVESMGFSLQKMRRALDEGGGHPVVLLFSGDLVTEVENTLPDASRDDVVARLEGLGWVAGDNWTAAQVKAVPPEEALRAAGHCGPQP